MATVQTSLVSFGSAATQRPLHHILGSREPRQAISGLPAETHIESVTDSSAAGQEWVLIQRAIAGNSDSQNSLFAAYSARLYRVAFAMLRNKEDAEDALQNGLCSAHIHLRSFQGRSSFRTWLTRIVVNSALMIRRRRSSRTVLSLDELLEDKEGRPAREFANTEPNPEEICSVVELDEIFGAEVDRLPAKLQTAFQLRGIDGLSIMESSRKLGIGKSAFKSRVMRARRRLILSVSKSLARTPSRHRI